MAKRSLDLESWSGEELVAAVLVTSPPGNARAHAAEAVAASLLCDFGGFAGLSRATIDEIEAQLANDRRLGRRPRACARRIAAAFEIGRRAPRDGIAPPLIASSAGVAAWASTRLSELDHEELWLLALDGRSRLRAVRCVAKAASTGWGSERPTRFASRCAQPRAASYSCTIIRAVIRRRARRTWSSHDGSRPLPPSSAHLCSITSSCRVEDFLRCRSTSTGRDRQHRERSKHDNAR
jgi:hypothetical protein